MAGSTPTPQVLELEISLFDEYVLCRRAGRTPDMDALTARLPEERRAAFRQLLATTSVLQTLGQATKARVAAALHDNGQTNPLVVEDENGGK